MEQTFTAETVASPDELFAILSDLTTYPHWLDVVSDVIPASEPESGTNPDSQDSVWIVTLRARVGPFARSKRLRMVRTSADNESRTVIFDRVELDGKDHSAWQLQATVKAVDEVLPAEKAMHSASTLRLRYDGAMWSGLLDGILESAAERATASLQDYVAQRGANS